MPRFFLLIMRLKKKGKKKEIPFYNSASAEWRASVLLKRPNEPVLLTILYSRAVVASWPRDIQKYV